MGVSEYVGGPRRNVINDDQHSTICTEFLGSGTIEHIYQYYQGCTSLVISRKIHTSLVLIANHFDV